MSEKRPVEDVVIDMVMGENEILRDYRTAEDKNKQVKILAELNCCTPRQMARYLADHGELVDGRLLGSGGARRKSTREQSVGKPRCVEPDGRAADKQVSESVLTAGVLRDLLENVNPDTVVRLGGDGLAGWMHVSVSVRADGEIYDAELTINPAI